MIFPLLSLGEIFKTAFINTLLGMGTVFVILIFISLIISLFAFIPKIQQAIVKKNPQTDGPIKNPPVDQTSVFSTVPAQSVMDDLELVAVITAAIAASADISEDDFIVRSIRRVRADKWTQKR
ncbi:MAG: OadG family transporter subunit [Lachnospiraceae bacterium]|nr:OadG family transporter subunit [Lachnospiraceae bacterium]